jgi:hypothetical protein
MVRVELAIVPPLILRVVHCSIGVLQQAFGIDAIMREDGYPDARRKEDFMTLYMERTLKDLEHSVGYLDCILNRIDF